MMRSMYQLLQEGVFYNRQVMFKQRTTRDMLLGPHRDQRCLCWHADGARTAVEQHLVEDALQPTGRTPRSDCQETI
jgi:GntR family transcriptional repressor for pyruvate dehydrogenase complex